MILGLVFVGTIHAQVGSSISSDGSAPNDNAMLDVQSPSTGAGKGMLIPRVTEAQRTTASSALAGGLLDNSGNLRGGAAQGLIVYQTDGNQGLYFNASQTAAPTWVHLGEGDLDMLWHVITNAIYYGDGRGITNLSAGTYSEIDPRWASASNAIMGDIASRLVSNIWAAADSTTNYLPRTGGTMSGTLNMGGQSVTNVSQIGFNGNDVSVGRSANGYSYGAAMGNSANATNCGVALGYNANGSESGAVLGYLANAYGDGAAVGRGANGSVSGAAVGRSANASSYGASMGREANGYYHGAAMGLATIGTNYGVAMGDSANGSDYGVAIGSLATGNLYSVAIGREANGSDSGVAMGYQANGYSSGAAVGYMGNGYSHGAAIGREANGYSSGAAVGESANGYSGGAAVGKSANGSSVGAAVGQAANGSSVGAAVGKSANGYLFGAAMGYQANGYSGGAAVGYLANGSASGAALGTSANGYNNGAAMGYQVNGFEYGVAIGQVANGTNSGVAIGYHANGVNSNIAIGAYTTARGGPERIAIGNYVNNEVDNSVVIRGTLYLDGGTGVVYRSGFGSGGWTAKAFEIDHPLDPENKVLRHFCLEGPQVWNVYAGNAQLVNGRAVVQLPDYYSALNLVGSEIYSLTPIGEALVWIDQEISSNCFVIAGKSDIKVSWTVKVLRNDPGCREDLRRRPVEQWKNEISNRRTVEE
jgi:hypothetical protein